MDDLTDKRFVIAGGSGFLGVSLAIHLADAGADVTILSRRPPAVAGPWKHSSWDARSLGSWTDAIDGADGLVNLAGRTVDCVKTPDNRDEILRSRIESTRVLGKAMRAVASPPPVWVQMSTAHIYGDPPELVCTEDSPFGAGLAPFVGQAWEAEYERAVLDSQRQVVLRTSFVIGRDRGAGAGALGTLRTLARFGLGGKVGSGKQGMSWLHEADMNRLFERGLTDDSMLGAYIATSPNPVSQVEFMRSLRRTMGISLGPPAGPPLMGGADADSGGLGRLHQRPSLVFDSSDEQASAFRAGAGVSVDPHPVPPRGGWLRTPPASSEARMNEQRGEELHLGCGPCSAQVAAPDRDRSR